LAWGTTRKSPSHPSKEAASPDADYHRPVPEGVNLLAELRTEEVRGVANDWTFRYGRRTYQITGPRGRVPPAKSKVRVQTWLDGSEHVARFRSVSVDPLEQTYTRQVRLEKWESGSLVASEEYLLRGNMYLKSEVVLMLRVAGFRAITVHGDYTDEPATADHEKLLFTAIR
jgi:hypothetical protein